MRTTITLDPDVDQLLRRTMRERGGTFRDTVNEAIRNGLRSHRAAPYRQKTYSMGINPGYTWDKALQMAADLEDREILKKMAEGK
jgi:hypothetical protein